mgnify:CR=1 FL=1|tara:strand:- start:32 stop:226 length:195 start_codon:yes stop_codon:yes gene_type:complete
MKKILLFALLLSPNVFAKYEAWYQFSSRGAWQLYGYKAYDSWGDCMNDIRGVSFHDIRCVLKVD